MGHALRTLSGLVLLVVLMAVPAFATNQVYFNPMDDQITPIASRVNDIYNLILWITIGIFVVVWGAMAYVLIKFRYKEGREIQDIHENLPLEITWTVVPVILLIIISVPTFRVLQYTEYTPRAEQTIEIIGHQFWWEYRYPDAGFSINGSQEPMRLPLNQNVRLLVTSQDVIHNFSVAHFGFKQDAIPGRVNERWVRVNKVGTYPVQCAQLCGALHANMLSTVEAMEPAAFASWLEEKAKAATAPSAAGPVTKEAMMQQGEKLYASNCASCHQATGQGIPGVFPPLVDSEWVTEDKARHIKVITEGLQGPITVKGQPFSGSMPPFGHLTDAEVAAIATYERNAWGNDAGIVTPADVKAVR